MNCLLPLAALCLYVGFATAQTGCNTVGCISQAQTWASAQGSGDKDRICSAGRSYRDCLGSDCSLTAAVTAALNQQGCGSTGGVTTSQTGCNTFGCTSQAQTWASVSVSGDKDRICRAGRSYRDCLGSDCSLAASLTRLLNQQGCDSTGGVTTSQTGCNTFGCTSQAQTWASVSVSGDKDRICRAGRSYRDCLGSDCSLAASVTRLLNQQGCGSERVWMSASSLLMIVVLTRLFM